VGAVVGVVKVKEPDTAALLMGEVADPPVSVDEASVCPELIALAVGHVTVGVALFTRTLTLLLTEE
jgi:hypothetical protein